MKKIPVAVLAVMIGLAFVTASFAQAPSEKPATMEKSSKSTGKTKSMTYSGEVVSADANTVVVKGKNGEKTFRLADTKWKGYTSADELKPGDKVIVSSSGKGKQMKAAMIEKQSVTERMKNEMKKDEEKIKEKLTPEKKSEPQK